MLLNNLAGSFAWKAGGIIPWDLEVRGVDPPIPPSSDAYACNMMRLHLTASFETLTTNVMEWMEITAWWYRPHSARNEWYSRCLLYTALGVHRIQNFLDPYLTYWNLLLLLLLLLLVLCILSFFVCANVNEQQQITNFRWKMISNSNSDV